MEMNPVTNLPSWLDKYNPVPLEWNGLRCYFAVLPVAKIKMNKGQIEGLPANPRRWDRDELQRLKNSIIETPELTLARGVLAYPLDGEVVALGGNMRRHSANLEPKEHALPCYVYPVNTPAEKLKEIVMKDNGTFGEFDWDEVANKWSDKDLVSWGIPAWEQRKAEAAQAGSSGANKDHQCDNKEDNTDGMDVEKRSAPGMIFRLGGHVLMCGDATDPAAVEAMLKAGGIETADLALTDPPYGISVVPKSGKIGGNKDKETEIARARNHGLGSPESCAIRVYRPVIGDETTGTARAAYGIMERLAKQQVVFGGNYFTDFLRPSKCWIVWDKGIYDGMTFADVELAWCSLDKPARMFRHMWNGVTREGDRDAEGRTRLHPTQKPVGLLTAIVERLFPDVETILDPFGGSGSTLIAAERLGKRCFMMEMSPDYCDVILARWERFAKQKAELLTPGEKSPETKE